MVGLMLTILTSIAPIFFLIVLGHLLRRGGIPSIEFWNQNDKLVYWVLFPSLLFYKMATLKVGATEIGSVALVAYAGFAAATMVALLVGKLLAMEPATWTSTIQGCARHNTFIALAVAERVFCTDGLAVAIIVTALIVPVSNILVVALMIGILRRDSTVTLPRVIARELFRNPLLVAIVLGLAVNLSGVSTIPILFDMTAILGAAALPIVLLCVGANIRVRAMVAATVPTLISVSGKMLLCPLVTGLVAVAVGLDGFTTLIVMIFAAAPTSANTYTLARQMGGNAPAMAAIVTIQTAISFITLPATLLAAQHFVAPSATFLVR